MAEQPPRLDRSALQWLGMVLIIVVVMAFLGSGKGLGAGTGVQCPPPPSVEIVACYPPTQVKKAEAQLPVTPIDLSAAILRIMGLPLASVITVKRGYPTPGKKVYLLTFYYGTFAGMIIAPIPVSPPLPKWVEVDEHVGKLPGQTGIHIGRAGIITSNVTPTTPQVMDWSLRDNLPNYRLRVVITTNEDRRTLVKIGKALRRLGKG